MRSWLSIVLDEIPAFSSIVVRLEGVRARAEQVYPAFNVKTRAAFVDPPVAPKKAKVDDCVERDIVGNLIERLRK